MRGSGSLYLVPILAVMLAGFSGAPRAFSQYPAGGPTVKGTVKSSDGKPVDGATVSVRGDGRSFVTTVFTNPQGTYSIPSLARGKYKLWAQAQGFQTAKADLDVSGGQTQQAAALELKPLKNFDAQMTGVEWLNSFPENTAQEKREKQIFVSNCSGCHDNHFALQNKFDANGWGKIITMMSMSSEGTVIRPNATGSPSINAYKEEIVGFLTKVRGPSMPSYALKPLPRPAGEAAQVLITEFDLPNQAAPPESYAHNGSDWMEGTPSRWEGRAAHDVAVGSDGNVFFSDDRVVDRTIGRLDPRTGKVTNFKWPDKNGVAATTHGIVADPEGNVWANNGATQNMLKFDPKTEKLTDYPRPAGMPGAGGTVAADSKGIVWATSGDGAVRLDPKSGEYTFYKLITPGKGTYGIATDSEGNAWYTSPGGDNVDVVDGKTGKTSEIHFPALAEDTGMTVDPRDKENYEKLRNNQNAASPLHQCPRRIGGDPTGDKVWVALFCSDRIASMDIHTHAVKIYPMPHKYSRPYGVVVDNDHNVWVNMLNTDMLAKFDPRAEKWTEYQMPSRGTDMRHLVVDYNVSPPAVYVPYNRSNKIARLQFRKASDMQ